jgi:O-acetyl-ADP-ribose deacetylase (regulator of RNase III)
MIAFKTGDILTDGSEALVNPVNCAGVMGAGLAKQFKEAFPLNFWAYEKECFNKHVNLGRVYVYETGQLTNPKYIVNFPTKGHWSGKSDFDDICAGLVNLKEEIISRDIKSVAIPPLGCGLGFLCWKEVRDLMVYILGELDEVEINIYEKEK